LYGAGLVLIGLLLRPDPIEIARGFAQVAASTASLAGSAIRPVRVILAQPATQLALLAMVTAQLVMSTVASITGVHMANHGHALGEISLVTMAHTLGMFGLSMIGGRLADNFGRAPTIVAGAVILIVGCALAPVSQQTSLLALSMFLVGL